jgi:hypothetical protein
MTKKSGLVLASAAATLLAAGGIAFASSDMISAKDEMVKCKGINECRGQSDGRMPGHHCKLPNACKGKGFKFEKSAEQCEKLGGTVME